MKIYLKTKMLEEGIIDTVQDYLSNKYNEVSHQIGVGLDRLNPIKSSPEDGQVEQGMQYQQDPRSQDMRDAEQSMQQDANEIQQNIPIPEQDVYPEQY